MASKIIIGILLTVFAAVVHAGEFCYKRKYSGGGTTFYCTTSCCGDSYSKYCCPTLRVAVIIGIVIGSLALLAILISVVVCCCCCNRSRGRTGQVVTQPGVVNMAATTVTTSNLPGQYAVNGTQMTYPAGYPQPMAQGYPGGNQPPPSYPDTQPKY